MKPQQRKKISSPAVESIQITTTLTGKDAADFREFKKRQFLKRDAEAARKLILERLSEISPAA